ncbi:reverse transcriptase domain-containing protein [Tanacetum coccineum]|uniref:Reverse transcriptase domain-containing protein n=1 Tax=Tanacetum coccineum TaxID=301880 RepID=A0ABQ5D925_9ASTR
MHHLNPSNPNSSQLKALIDQGVADALAACDAARSMNSDDNHDSGPGVRRQDPLARDMENQIKFATHTLLGSALTWWNAHVRTVGHDVVYAMTWTNLKKMMTNKYCPRGEVKKLEVEMWNLKVKARCCLKIQKIEKYVGGLPDMIHESVMASKPKTVQDAIEFATDLMDKKISNFAKRQAENKRKLDNNNQAQQQPPKKQRHYRSDCSELKNQNHGNQSWRSWQLQLLLFLLILWMRVWDHRPTTVIHFGDIPTIVWLGSLYGFRFDSLDEMSSPEHISPLPAISPFLCIDSSEAPDSSDGPHHRTLMLLPFLIGGAGEAFRHWCVALLSTLYPPTTSESSSGDPSERLMHLSLHSAGPSCKRYRSMVDSVPLSTPVTGSLAPTRADLLPPHKRFKDSYSSEASIEEDAEVGPIRLDKVGINPMIAPIVEEEIVEPAGEDSSDSSGTRDGIVRSVEDMPVDLDDAVRDFYHHMSEVRVDRIVGIETAQRRLEADQLMASGDRARMAEMIYSLRLENLKVRAMLDIERDRVSSLRLHMSLSQEEFRQIRRDRDDARGRLRRLESYLERRFGFRP